MATHGPPEASWIRDPKLRANFEAILRSPSYILAEEDQALLKRDELRPIRLQLEYFKPELTLQEHNIRTTIVVFGSTRILSPERAHEQVENLKKLLERAPEDEA